jgi:hypothetical protein
MGQAAKRTRGNRTITVDFQDETTYIQLLSDGRAFVELVLAFLLSLGFQLKHKTTCSSGGCLTRHSHYVRVRLGGVSIWRLQCTTCKAVFIVLPHFVLRYRSMHPDRAKLPGKLTAIASPVRKALRSQFHTLWYRARQRKSWRVFALGQRLCYFADHVTPKAGMANGERVRCWFQ